MAHPPLSSGVLIFLAANHIWIVCRKLVIDFSTVVQLCNPELDGRMNLPTKRTVRDCLGKHAIGLYNWDLDIISPCFEFIEDIFGLCETSNKDDLLWESELRSRRDNKRTGDTHINGPINCSGSLLNAVEYLLDERVEEAEHIIPKSAHENRKAAMHA